MDQFNTEEVEKRRTFAIISHPDAGKTTITEKLLLFGGAIQQAGYRQVLDDLCHFLEGKTQPVVERLQSEMLQAAEEMRFEQAAALRDQS